MDNLINLKNFSANARRVITKHYSDYPIEYYLMTNKVINGLINEITYIGNGFSHTRKSPKIIKGKIDNIPILTKEIMDGFNIGDTITKLYIPIRIEESGDVFDTWKEVILGLYKNVEVVADKNGIKLFGDYYNSVGPYKIPNTTGTNPAIFNLC